MQLYSTVASISTKCSILHQLVYTEGLGIRFSPKLLFWGLLPLYLGKKNTIIEGGVVWGWERGEGGVEGKGREEG